MTEPAQATGAGGAQIHVEHRHVRARQQDSGPHVAGPADPGDHVDVAFGTEQVRERAADKRGAVREDGTDHMISVDVGGPG
ncbi:hypothetical protein ACFQX7_33830 [Luedemannella flava]